MYPIIFQSGGLTIHAYGLTMMIALIVIYLLAARRIDGSILSHDDLDNIGLLILLSIWLGGTLVHLAMRGEYTGDVLAGWSDFKRVHRMGTASILTAFGLSLFLYCSWKNKPLFAVLDYLTPFFALGYGIQRTFGCFLSGDSYGIPTDMPWGVVFPDTGGVGPEPGVAVHPTQLYMGIAAVATFWILERRPHWRHHPGVVTGVGMIGIFGIYFVVSFFRGDMSGQTVLFELGVSQVFSLLLFIAGLFLCIRAIRPVQRAPQPPTQKVMT